MDCRRRRNVINHAPTMSRQTTAGLPRFGKRQDITDVNCRSSANVTASDGMNEFSATTPSPNDKARLPKIRGVTAACVIRSPELSAPSCHPLPPHKRLAWAGGAALRYHRSRPWSPADRPCRRRTRALWSAIRQSG